MTENEMSVIVKMSIFCDYCKMKKRTIKIRKISFFGP